MVTAALTGGDELQQHPHTGEPVSPRWGSA
jgi:hypothetical protein